jgi:membrane protease YdiL (CAAX protease family)
MKRSLVSGPAAEIALMTALLLSYLWLWQGSFPWDFFVCLALYFGIGVWGHWRWKESAAEIGVRIDNIGPSLRFGLKLVGPLIVAAVALGAWLGTLHAPKSQEPSELAFSLVRGLVWATMQQYGLACVYYRRFEDLLGNPWGASVAAAGFFALCHLPNPFLTPVTFAAGILACRIYRRAPNLFVLGFLHLLLSIALRNAFGPDITHRMKVGPGYWGD